MELSDEAVLAIKHHLMAVADLLGGVPVPNGRPAPKTGRRAVNIRVFMRAINMQTGPFTVRMLATSLASLGFKMRVEAVNHRLRKLVLDGAVDSIDRGIYTRKGG